MQATAIPFALSGDLVLRPDEVHVWLADLDLKAETFEELRGALSAEENARALQFRFAVDRTYFIAARAVLRYILAAYTGQEPRNLMFSYTGRGKPSLRKGFQRHEITFNLSHSERYALYAVSRSRAVGIDLERVESFAGRQQIANRFLSAGERIVLERADPTSQTQTFFRIWTRKEAYLKARGIGLSNPLRGFDAPLKHGEAATIVDETGLRWKAAELLPTPGYVGAVAAEGDDWRLKFLQWIAPTARRDPQLPQFVRKAPPYI
jgi:4'-phosphopantetheinyl transferase